MIIAGDAAVIRISATNSVRVIELMDKSINTWFSLRNYMYVYFYTCVYIQRNFYIEN